MRFVLNSFLFLLFSITAFSQTWQGLGVGVNSSVYAMLVDSNNSLIVGGSFSEVDNNPQTCLAVWDSLNWHNFPGNPVFKNFAGVYCMTYWNGNLVVAGQFDSIDNIAAHNIAMWNGTTWQAFGDGFDHYVLTLSVYHDTLYAGGNFSRSGNDTVVFFGKWTGQRWNSVNGYFDGRVFSSVVFDDLLYIAGGFKHINGSLYASIATWNDSIWNSVGVGFNHEVNNLVILDDTLYACGTFTSLPQNPVSYIAKFDGVNWNQIPYPQGSTNSVRSIAKYHDKYFVCGDFNNPDDLGVINGNNLDSIGSTNGGLLSIQVYKDELYVGGAFTSIANLNTSCIAKLDTSFSLNTFWFKPTPNIRIFPTLASINSRIQLIATDDIIEQIEEISFCSITTSSICKFKENQFPLAASIFPPSAYLVNIKFTNGYHEVQKLIILP